MPMPSAVTSCPRCRRSTASPFAANGVCLRCAAEKLLSLANADPSDVALGALDGNPAGPLMPQKIGPYEVIEELGRGGMGHIYAARQVGLGRIVALKVLPVHGTPAELDLRFLREAQTVARLHHPHIVAVYDSGRTERYVYFSMEYLPDGDLGRRLRSRAFAPGEAAVLMQKVAGAVAAAHREGVLHRDIKPSNILLAGDEPKLADFGLAAELEPGGDLTAISGVLGTPHYLAPEALRRGSGALSVASDVYALGAVLYECLTGRAPFAGASPAEIATLIETTEPPPIALLAPATPRDLQTICLTCLAREPGRRYASAAALATDLYRFLNGLPIQARRAGAVDRWSKFARRHRTGVAVAATAVVALCAGTVTSALLAVRARRAERNAAHEAATATALAEFLKNDLLAQAGPDVQPDRNVTLHTVLDRAAQKVEGRFPTEPLVEAEVHRVVGEVYDSLGDFEAARRHLEKGLALEAGRLGESDPRTLRTLHELAGVMHDCGNLPECLRLATRAYVHRRAVLGADDPETIESADLVALVLRDLGRFDEADRMETPNVVRARRVLDAHDQHLISALRTLGVIRLYQYRYAEAEPLLRDAAQRQAEKTGPAHSFTLAVQNDLAECLRQQGKLAEAATLYGAILDARRRLLGPDHPDTLTSMNNLAAAYRSLKRLAEAEPLQRDALVAGERVLGPEHPRVIVMRNNLAQTYRLAGRLDEAVAEMKRTVELERTVLGAKHPNTVGGIATLGEMFVERGDASSAEPLLREALTLCPGVGVPMWKLESLRSQLGLALMRQGRFSDAEPFLVSSYERLRAAHLPAPKHSLLEDAAKRVIQLYRATGRAVEADRLAATLR